MSAYPPLFSLTPSSRASSTTTTDSTRGVLSLQTLQVLRVTLVLMISIYMGACEPPPLLLNEEVPIGESDGGLLGAVNPSVDPPPERVDSSPPIDALTSPPNDSTTVNTLDLSSPIEPEADLGALDLYVLDQHPPPTPCAPLQDQLNTWRSAPISQTDRLPEVNIEAMTALDDLCPLVARWTPGGTSRWRLTLEASIDDPALPLDSRPRAMIIRPGWLRGSEDEVLLEERAEVTLRFLDSESIEFTIESGGERLLTIDPSPFSIAPPAYTLTCLEGCDQQSARHPLVLVHGFAGTDEYFGVLEYFYRVPDHLRQRGFDPHTPSLSPNETSEVKAQQLATALDEILSKTGAERVHLIGHSQGGLDGRVLYHDPTYGPLIASLTTIATPHRGIPIPLIHLALRHDFSPEAMVDFNARYPDLPSARIFSWSFRSCALLDRSCQRDSDGERIDALLIPSFRLLQAADGDNDGIVPTSSMSWGTHQGLRYADHFDEIGQITDSPGENESFDHFSFYLEVAVHLIEL